MKHIISFLLPLLTVFTLTTSAKGHSPFMATHFESHKYPFELLKGKKYDGYIVYHKDTIQGYISFKMGAVWVENGMNNPAGRYKLNDKYLYTIKLTNTEGTTMYILKFGSMNGKYYRLVHEGKLSMYDRHFVFSKSPDDVDIENMVVRYDGTSKELNNKLGLNAKKDLAEVINQVYGTDIDPRNYNKNKLVSYALTLD